MMSGSEISPSPAKKKSGAWNIVRQQKFLFVLLLPGLAAILLFRYAPLYGILLAFKNYDPPLGILGSPWVGLKHFAVFLNSPGIQRVFWNTIRISLLKIVFGFPAPIILAILLNEVRSNGARRVIQTVSYLPHFISWIVVTAIIQQILSPSTGLVGWFHAAFLRTPAPLLLASSGFFLPMIVVSDIWKEVGWGSVVYLATMATINPELYEAAGVDGAGRLRRIFHITIPGIFPVVVLLFILRVGSIMEAGFDQVFNLTNPLTMEVGDIIDTYIYRVGLQSFQISFATAVGLTKNIIGFALLLLTNQVSKRFSDYTLW